MAVQLGKALGLYVVAVAGPSNTTWVKEVLGADEVVDYSKQVSEWEAAYTGTDWASKDANQKHQCPQSLAFSPEWH